MLHAGCRRGEGFADAKGGEAEAEAGSGAGAGRRRRRALLSGTLFTIAVAIVSMIVFKRARLVRLVRA